MRRARGDGRVEERQRARAGPTPRRAGPERLAPATRSLARAAAAVPGAPHGSGRPPEAVTAVRAEVVDDRLSSNVPDDQFVSSSTQRWKDGS